MAYTPTVWATGDVITAVKLNNMEQGIEDAFVAPEVTAADQGKVLTVDSSGDWAAAASSIMICHIVYVSEQKATIDQTYDDIVAAINAGRMVEFINVDSEYGIICNYMLIGTYDAADPSPNQVLLYGQDPSSGSLAQFMFAEASGVLTWEDGAQ